MKTFKYTIAISFWATFFLSSKNVAFAQNIFPSTGNVGIGTISPEAKLHVTNAIMSSDPNYPSINVRLDGTGIPTIKFSRDGDGNRMTYHNAFIGQFWNTSLSSYSLGIGTGSSYSGDANANNTVITIPLNGNVGIGNNNPVDKLHVNGGYTGQGHLMLYAYEGEGASGTSYIQARDRSGTSSISMQFRTQQNGSYVESMRILPNGNVGIGTTNPQSLLAVAGTITSKEVNVTLSGWADYVFENTYKLRPLSQVESFIKENKHLPEVPSATEVKANGINLGEMDALLLKKIEELTLYVIEQQKEIKDLKTEVTILKSNSK